MPRAEPDPRSAANAALLDRRDRPLVFVADLDDPELDPDDHHHLSRVLRIADGTAVTIGDGYGRWRVAAFARRPEPQGPIHVDPTPPWTLSVGFAPVKGDRPDWTVQKLTELGIDRILVVTTERSVVRWDAARWAKQHERLGRIAREASMQSRRVWLPSIESPAPLEQAWRSEVERFGPEPASDAPVPDRGAVALADPDGPALGPDVRSVFIGPEGGFGPAERERRPTVSLPGGVLRAETAALAAATIMAAWRSAGGRLSGP